jgi:Rrf2 family protein
MNSISQTTGYALEALACIASREVDYASVQDIAECAGIPPSYLAKIVHRLAMAGIINTKRGYRGGIQLARAPREIKLIEIHQAVEHRRPPREDEEAYLAAKAGPARTAQSFCQALQTNFIHQLEEITLADVLSSEISD